MFRPPDPTPPAKSAAFWAAAVAALILLLTIPESVYIGFDPSTITSTSPVQWILAGLVTIGPAVAYGALFVHLRHPTVTIIRVFLGFAIIHAAFLAIGFVVCVIAAADEFWLVALAFVLAGLLGGLFNLIIHLFQVLTWLRNAPTDVVKGFEPIMRKQEGRGKAEDRQH
jgi:hypothetical protein